MPESNDLDQVLIRAAVNTNVLHETDLKRLEQATQARQASLEREHGRLSGKLGADHPRTKTLALRLETGSTRLRDLKVEVVRAETVAPQAGASDWVLHGYVRWKDLNPAADLTVALVDGRGLWVQALGYACTDERGHFQLVASIGPTEPGKQAERPAAPAPPSERLVVHIRVTDRNRLELYRGEEAVPVAAGGVEYQEIVLGDRAAGCVSPEDDIPGPSPAPKKKASAPRRPRKR